MENIIREIKGGELGNVDDPKASGGFVMEFSGGKGIRTRKVVGNKSSDTVRDKMLEWGAFMEIYPDLEKLDTSGMKAMCKTVKLVIDSQNCLNPEDTLEILKTIYALPDEKLSQMFIRRFNFRESTKDALESIYVNWVDHLEKEVINYIQTREKYVAEKGGISNDVKVLMKNWNAVDKYYNISSSSPLLLYTRFPERPYDLPWLRGTFTEADVWGIYPLPFYWIVKGVPATLKLDKKLKKFTYLGFCPRRPKFRLSKLFEFPLEELHIATRALGGKVSNPGKYGKLVKLIEKGNIKVQTFAVPLIKRKKEPDMEKIQQKIKWYVEEIIEIYKHLNTHFKKVEKYYTDVAKKMSEIGIKIERL